MRASDIFRLVLLAAIWGGSFVFLRVVAPVFGPIVTADLRVLIAWGALAIYCRTVGLDVGWRRFWKQYLVIGAFNAALPFALFAFAALHIPASYSAILNATSPFFGALFAGLWLGEKITLPKCVGFVFGIAGVALVTGVAPAAAGGSTTWAMVACLLAAHELRIRQRLYQEVRRRGESTRNRLRQSIDGESIVAAIDAVGAATGASDGLYRSEYDLVCIIE